MQRSEIRHICSSNSSKYLHQHIIASYLILGFGHKSHFQKFCLHFSVTSIHCPCVMVLPCPIIFFTILQACTISFNFLIFLLCYNWKMQLSYSYSTCSVVRDLFPKITFALFFNKFNPLRWFSCFLMQCC